MKTKKILICLMLIIFSFSIFTGCGQMNEIIGVDSISISKKNLYLAEGQTAQISAQVYPFNADNQNFEIVSSNESVVSVDNGFVKANKAGNATITAISEDGGYRDVCNVLVTTVKNNLAINNYNNMNMPFNISQQKEYLENETNDNNNNDNDRKSDKENNKIYQKTSKNQQKNTKKQQNLYKKVSNLQNDVQENNQETNLKSIINNIKDKTFSEITDNLNDGKNVFNQLKTEFSKTFDDFKNLKIEIVDDSKNTLKTETENTINMFQNFQTEIFESMSNIQNQIFESFENINTQMQGELDYIKDHSDEYTVETKDINGVKFVVITNSNNTNQD